MASRHSDRPSWARRWLVIRLSLVFIAALTTYIVVWGPDDRVRETALAALLGTGTCIITGYCGFATWDDRNFLRHLRDRDDRSPASEPSGSPE